MRANVQLNSILLYARKNEEEEDECGGGGGDEEDETNRMQDRHDPKEMKQNFKSNAVCTSI